LETFRELHFGGIENIKRWNGELVGKEGLEVRASRGKKLYNLKKKTRERKKTKSGTEGGRKKRSQC